MIYRVHLANGGCATVQRDGVHDVPGKVRAQTAPGRIVVVELRLRVFESGNSNPVAAVYVEPGTDPLWSPPDGRPTRSKRDSLPGPTAPGLGPRAPSV